MSLFIGLMSGTSIDGIDAVLADFDQANGPKIIATCEMPWTREEHRTLNALCTPGADEIHRSGLAANLYADKAATLVNKMLAASPYKAYEIEAIASHGQTIRHEPNNGFSVQISNHARLAALTGIDVICDFRSMDLACGGQGAPLVPAFHSEICSHPTQTRYIVNIGGIANVTALIPGHHVFGFDTGPGNTLMDFLAERLLNQSCDANGDTAARGEIKESIVNFYLEEPYFKLQPPKSTGRELFNQGFLNRCQRFTFLSPEDKLATITELTAISIIRGIKSIGIPGDIYVCGGGLHNSYLMSRLKHHAELCSLGQVRSIAALGIDPDFLEALAFAWLGYKFKRHEALDMSWVTGAKRKAVLGCLYPHP